MDKIYELVKNAQESKRTNLTFKQAVAILKSDPDLVAILPWFHKGEGFAINKFGWLYGNRSFAKSEALSSEWSVIPIKKLI